MADNPKKWLLLGLCPECASPLLIKNHWGSYCYCDKGCCSECKSRTHVCSQECGYSIAACPRD